MSDTMSVTLTVNGSQRSLLVRPDQRLLDPLREQLGLFSVRDGCSVGICGSCTVLLNGQAVSSCLTLAALCQRAEVLTAEGLSSGVELDRVAQAFVDHRAFQCSYCTPGFILAMKGLLASTPRPDRGEIEACLRGHLCRCGSYSRILAAAMDVASVDPAHGNRPRVPLGERP